MTPALAETLAMVSDAAAGAHDRWWIIGSAAVVLHGRSVPQVRDVDLLMSAGDAEQLLKRAGQVPRSGTPDPRFRSLVFGTWRKARLPVEVMGGFSVNTGGTWREVRPATRQAVTVQGACVFVPSADELVQLLEWFGRPKDLERARLLRGPD
jgi:hypothetical protein